MTDQTKKEAEQPAEGGGSIRARGVFGAVAPPSRGGTSVRKYSWIVLILLGVSCLGGGLWLWLERERQFPMLSPGSYIGTLSGVLGEEGSDEATSIPVYIERAPESEELFVAILAPAWRPQLVSTTLHTGGGGAAQWVLPLLISQGKQRLELMGEATSPNTFGGKVINVATGKEGTWQLSPLRSPPRDVDRQGSDVRLWMMLKAELDGVQQRIAEFERQVPAQKAEIEQLTKLLTEGEELRHRANEKFGLVKEEFAASQRAREEAKQKVAQLEQAVDVSQKITPMGKLVSLSRESLEREWRVVDSLLRSTNGSSSPDLDEEFARAQKALDLQAEIERLKLQRRPPSSQAALGASDARARMRMPFRRGT